MMSLSRILKSRETALADIKVIQIANISFEQGSESTDFSEEDFHNNGEIDKRSIQEQYEQLLNQMEEYKHNLLVQQEQAQAKMLAEVQMLREQACKEGFEDGYRDGIQQGFEAGKKEYEALIGQAQQIVNSVLLERQQYIQENESVMLELSTYIAECILRDHINQNPEYVIPIAKAALSEVQDIQQVEIRVHPNDYNLVFNAKQTLLTTLPGQNELLIIPDLAVNHGGCVIHTAYGSVDARIDSQLQEIRHGLQIAVKGVEA